MNSSTILENLYQEEIYGLPARTLILIDRDWTEISNEEKVLLYKILGSVRLSAAAVQILHRDDLSINDLMPLNVKRIISFGVRVNPVQKQYEHVPMDGLDIILSDSLSSLDDARKKNLWLALKQMFTI
jgi:hypothetical protein